MEITNGIYDLSNENSSNREYLFDKDSFANLISPEGEINNTFFSNLINEWKENEQTNLYVGLDNSNSPKIKIDKLIASGELAQSTIQDFNNQILSENAAQIFDFGNGIAFDKNLDLALDLYSIKNFNDFVKSWRQGSKLYFDGNVCTLMAICFCKIANGSIDNINEILQLYPKFVSAAVLLPVERYSENSIKNVNQFWELASNVLSNMASVDSEIGNLICNNIYAFDKDAFQDFIDKGFEFQAIENNDGKIEKQFFFTDLDCALETNFFDLSSLTLKAQNFGKNSIQNIKVFYFENNEGAMFSETCYNLIKHNPEAFVAGAFKKINLSDDNICIFLGLDQGTDKQSVIKYKILGYFLYVFLIGFLFGLSKKFLEKAESNEEYNQYLDQIKKLIERDNVVSPQESQETTVQPIDQKISQISNFDVTRPSINSKQKEI